MAPLTPEMIRREDNEALGGVVQRSNLVFTPQWSGGMLEPDFRIWRETPLTVPKRREPKQKTHIREHPVPGLADIRGHQCRVL